MKIKYINRKTGEIEEEVPPAEGLLRFLYNNPLGRVAFLPLVKRRIITEWYGREMNKPSSTKKIQKFVNQLNIDLSEAQKKISQFTSFNDFFYRKLKPGIRPIENGFVSPGDGRILAFEKATDISKYYIKGRKFTLQEFLKNKKLADRHINSSLFILRLSPGDYHRFHFPCSGTPGESTAIKGHYYSVSPHALKNNFTRIFCENKREYIILKTQDKGEVVIAPVGATMVGSIVETYTPHHPVKKGEEMGYFQFGGSTIVLLIDNNQWSIAPDILQNTQNKIETFVQMGESIAH